ncbi:uncharacterized protein LOC142236009 [Haematobia irritans]|uniref:uncharacterized protein LOC142236009 n=1 Tax=Haematobia irritans TaxID=7368 RepID=UPI003F4FBCF8
MDVMIFGATCAPSISQYIKNLNATSYEQDFPIASKCIKENHYVDDLLISVDTPEQAVILIADVTYIHEKAGFNIRNWISNSHVVMNSLHQNGEEKEKCLNIGEGKQVEKVLGIFWEHNGDSITFKISDWLRETNVLAECKKPTKREILRTIMAIYDPLGLIGHIIMYVKILLQEVWRSKIDWDMEIPDSLMVKWTQWIKILPDMQNLKIPRCYLQYFMNYSDVEVQLHTFVDASRDGYAAVCYFRLMKDSTIVCSIIGSKTKVAPLKIISVPRLELMAALIGARFADYIAKNHKIKIDRKFYWSDSKTVLSWLKSDHRNYHQFVAFRVTEILDLSNIREWNWISTKQNVADDATRWGKLPNITKSHRWFKGPEFLNQPEGSWPNPEIIPESTQEESVHHSMTLAKYCPPFDVQRFSRWERLKRSAAYVVRFLQNCRSSIKEKGELTQSELMKAENLLYRQAQKEKYSAEISCLVTQNSISKGSEIFSKSPYLDDGVLRVNSRIDNANIPDDNKRPIILPKESYITNLIILYFHKKFFHMNHETAVNEIRQKYAIARLRTLYKAAVRNCQACKINRATPQPPEMAKLPRARLATFEAPFTFSGVDFFGPIWVVVNRHREKRYGCLITCLTIRAVRIEVAHSLTTDSCILAIRNFMSRRGIPREFYSDNGTNFIGAERELREALADVNKDELVKAFTSSTCKWNFNPPGAPHMGGAWERLVRSVKTVLYNMMPSRSPSDELLRSMLIEVENVINSRPLSYVPLDDVTSEAITPNHFLLGSSSGLKPMSLCNDSGVALKHNWRVSQQYANIFWKRWISEYLPTLTCRTKWHERRKPLCQGDLVIVVDPSLPRNVWIRGKVVETRLAKDGQVRSAKIITSNGIMERPVNKLAILDVSSEKKSDNERMLCHTAGGMLPPHTETP